MKRGITMAKITERNTKSEILSAYEAAMEEIKKLKSEKFNPVEEQQSKKNKEIIEKADITSENNIINPAIIEEYKNLKSAISLKRDELRELYGIDIEANSFAALVEAKNTKLDELDKQIEDKKIEYVDLSNSLSESHKARIQQLNDEACEYKNRLKKDRDREEEDFKYNLERERRIENDKWEDEKAQRLAAVEEREEAVSERELSHDNMVNEIKELNDKLSEVPAAIEAAKEEAAKEAKSKAEKSFAFEKRAMESDYSHMKEMLESKLDTLNEKIADLISDNEELKSNLNAAYEKIENIANESVKNSGVKILDNSSNK